MIQLFRKCSAGSNSEHRKWYHSRYSSLRIARVMLSVRAVMRELACFRGASTFYFGARWEYLHSHLSHSKINVIHVLYVSFKLDVLALYVYSAASQGSPWVDLQLCCARSTKLISYCSYTFKKRITLFLLLLGASIGALVSLILHDIRWCNVVSPIPLK